MKNILVVDDNEMILNTLAWGLRAYCPGWEIFTASTGNDAVKILEASSMDFVLTDLEMPGMDGFQLIEYIRKHHSAIPRMAMTGNYSAEAENRLYSLGTPDVMEKPFNIINLANRISANLHCPAVVPGAVQLEGC